METLLVYQSFGDKAQAYRTAALLERHDIFVVVEEVAAPLDSNFLGQQFFDPFVLKLYGSQFEKANEVLTEHTEIRLEEVDPGYSLLAFSDEELLEVMKNKNDWGVYNYKLAEKLLQQREVAIPAAEIGLAQQDQLAAERKPGHYDTYWLVFGYVMALLSGYFLYTPRGGYIFILPAMFACVIGLGLIAYRKTLSDGSRMYVYGKSVRIHGVFIFILALVSLLLRSWQLSGG